MRLAALRLIGAMLAVALLAGAATARPDPRKHGIVEQILTRAVLERGAFLACARLDTSKQTANLLVRGWQADLEDASSLMRALGYTDDDIRAAADRFDIEKAAPHFANLASLGAYCNVLGDWRTRLMRLDIILPQAELRKLLKP
jgi:hypothetical protein